MEKIEVRDLIRNPETGLVGELKKEGDYDNYYVVGDHPIAGRWQTTGGKLKDYQRGWKLFKKGSPSD